MQRLRRAAVIADDNTEKSGFRRARCLAPRCKAAPGIVQTAQVIWMRPMALFRQTVHALPQWLLAAALLPLPGLHAQQVEAALASVPALPAVVHAEQLIVIGFMGGNVHADNLIHREATLAKELQQHDPLRLHAAVFANHDGQSALRAVLKFLDADGDGRLSAGEKNAARIVIYGHSWGASEAVTLARRLNELHIPVLLTIQVDSVEKSNEDDRDIPPNVRQAINFYQTRGLIHGRTAIAAMDPVQTKILGNYQSSYRDHPVACDDFPWFARTFMKPHIEIENDPSVWSKIEALIRAQMS
jgi:hypothetical protein